MRGVATPLPLVILWLCSTSASWLDGWAWLSVTCAYLVCSFNVGGGGQVDVGTGAGAGLRHCEPGC